MKTDLREWKWRTPADARRARRRMFSLLVGWFSVDLIVYLYWRGFWEIVDYLGVWKAGIVIGMIEIFSTGGWMRGWEARDRRSPDG